VILFLLLGTTLGTLCGTVEWPHFFFSFV
jgi:hypothetical protein